MNYDLYFLKSFVLQQFKEVVAVHGVAAVFSVRSESCRHFKSLNLLVVGQPAALGADVCLGN